MVKELRRTRIRKGLIGGIFLNFLQRHRGYPRTLPVVSDQSAGFFAPIRPWECLKLNFEQMKKFLLLLAVESGSGTAAGGGSSPSRRLGLLLRQGCLANRVRIWCENGYLYPFPFNLGHPSRLISIVQSRLNRKWIWTVHRDLIWTIRSLLRRERIRTVHTCRNKSSWSRARKLSAWPPAWHCVSVPCHAVCSGLLGC